MPHRQEAPYAMQIELTEGCNLYCDFCGLKGIRAKKEKNYKFMTVKLAQTIAAQMAELGWNARIEMAMHGEPTMHPDPEAIVAAFRERLPNNQIMMTSNGGGIVKQSVRRLEGLFDAGLNIFALDAYETVKLGEKIMQQIEGMQISMATVDAPYPFSVHYYPEESVSPHSRYPKNTRLFIRMEDISVAKEGTHSSLNNHCGAGSPGLAEPMQQRCAKPFREMSVRWDGNVAICCNDWRGLYKIGNVKTDPLWKLWQHPRMNAARKMLYHRRRDLLSPCDICDAKSYRVGLLPDKKGKVELPKPTARDKKLAAQAIAKKPYTKANKQPWELIASEHRN